LAGISGCIQALESRSPPSHFKPIEAVDHDPGIAALAQELKQLMPLMGCCPCSPCFSRQLHNNTSTTAPATSPCCPAYKALQLKKKCFLCGERAVFFGECAFLLENVFSLRRTHTLFLSSLRFSAIQSYTAANAQPTGPTILNYGNGPLVLPTKVSVADFLQKQLLYEVLEGPLTDNESSLSDDACDSNSREDTGMESQPHGSHRKQKKRECAHKYHLEK
jgi:hypothetical protein